MPNINGKLSEIKPPTFWDTPCLLRNFAGNHKAFNTVTFSVNSLACSHVNLMILQSNMYLMHVKHNKQSQDNVSRMYICLVT